MKLAPIFVFFLYWINISASLSNSEICQELGYITSTDEYLRDKYQKEYSLVSNVGSTLSKVFRRKEIKYPPKIEGKLAKFLCACALSKIEKPFAVKNSDTDEETAPATSSFDEIYQRTVFDKIKLGIYIWPYYVAFPFYEHHFPATYCSSSITNKYLIAKAPDKNSDRKESYNIYVAEIVKWYNYEEPIYDMLGFITEVDLEKLKIETSYN